MGAASESRVNELEKISAAEGSGAFEAPYLKNDLESSWKGFSKSLNLGGDADSTAAVRGWIASAHCGLDNTPEISPNHG